MIENFFIMFQNPNIFYCVLNKLISLGNLHFNYIKIEITKSAMINTIKIEVIACKIIKKYHNSAQFSSGEV